MQPCKSLAFSRCSPNGYEIDPKALVTVGAWSEFTLTNETFSGFNFYKDECMRLASGDEDDDSVFERGVLVLYSTLKHTTLKLMYCLISIKFIRMQTI